MRAVGRSLRIRCLLSFSLVLFGFAVSGYSGCRIGELGFWDRNRGWGRWCLCIFFSVLDFGSTFGFSEGPRGYGLCCGLICG